MTDPENINASPFGWHDTNGMAGAEFTTTRGNNVWAQEDADGNNGTGYSPDGGTSLEFDFPLNLDQEPEGYRDASITNLFYWNNFMHDLWYEYGFDEAAGNFQERNYGNGGVGGDFVFADAQDGSRTNNANFLTPPDGDNGRMQMFLWNAPPPSPIGLLTINGPSNIAGAYLAQDNSFVGGIPAPDSPLIGDLALVEGPSGIGTPSEGCTGPLINTSDVNGKIAVIVRGSCEFTVKVNVAETAGAAAVIVVNNAPGVPIVMAGQAFPPVSIPSIMISQSDGQSIMDALNNGDTVNGTIQSRPGGETFEVDGTLDNGIIAHEYTHGISNRLTGGASNVDCLDNIEQMGEGWSDWFTLIMTIESGDISTDIRGVGTFATSQDVLGTGIRPAPYSTDTAINDFTYADVGDTANITVPHGVGFVWCTMLWDLTWALIDEYGYDPDLFNGVGGNNIAMQLIMDGMKLQPCSPGFVDGRDAILAADQALYGGANACIIWDTFAARGLGLSADQGSTNDRTDQTEAFDVPECETASIADNNLSAIRLFPNPSRDNINVVIPQFLGDGIIAIYDISGRNVFAQEMVLEGVLSVNMEDLSSGLYFVNIMGKGISQTLKLVIE